MPGENCCELHMMCPRCRVAKTGGLVCGPCSGLVPYTRAHAVGRIAHALNIERTEAASLIDEYAINSGELRSAEEVLNMLRAARDAPEELFDGDIRALKRAALKTEVAWMVEDAEPSTPAGRAAINAIITAILLEREAWQRDIIREAWVTDIADIVEVTDARIAQIIEDFRENKAEVHGTNCICADCAGADFWAV
jgi:hypothetical protein